MIFLFIYLLQTPKPFNLSRNLNSFWLPTRDLYDYYIILYNMKCEILLCLLSTSILLEILTVHMTPCGWGLAAFTCM